MYWCLYFVWYLVRLEIILGWYYCSLCSCIEKRFWELPRWLVKLWNHIMICFSKFVFGFCFLLECPNSCYGHGVDMIIKMNTSSLCEINICKNLYFCIQMKAADPCFISFYSWKNWEIISYLDHQYNYHFLNLRYTGCGFLRFWVL